MSINSMLFNGLSGVNSMSGKMGVLADNVANVNSVAYKTSNLSFSDIMSSTIEGIGQMGNGSGAEGIVKSFEAGSLESTSRSTDMAVVDNGFFILNDPNQTEPVYTRDGQFRAAENTGDAGADLKLVNASGYFVQGVNMGSLLNPTGVVEDVVIGKTSLPQATENITVAVNLQNDPEQTEVSEENLFSSWDGTNFTAGKSDPIADSAYGYQCSINCYDDSSESTKFPLSIYFDQTTQDNEQEFLVTCDPTLDRRLIGDSDIRYNDGGETVNKGAGALLYGKLSFDTSGELNKITCWEVPADGNLNPTADNQLELGRGEAFNSFSYNISGVGPNLSSTLSFGNDPIPQVVTSLGIAKVDGGDGNIALSSESTTWDKVYDENGNKVQAGDVMTFSGTNGDGMPVALDYAVDFNNPVGDLLSSLASAFSCNATITDGVLNLEDLEIGDSQLAISSIAYQDSSGNSPTTNPSLAEVFGVDGGSFATNQGNRAQPSAISTTNYATGSKTLFKNQDGYGKGYLQDVNVRGDGVVLGIYSNGQTLEQAQVVLADFVNYGGLRAIGGNNYLASEEAGAVTVSAPGENNIGEVVGNALEMSNVNLAGQFVHLISTQRIFQANSVSIKTADEVYQTALQLL